MTRIAFICFYEAFPPASGAASVTYGLAKFAPGERYLLQVGRTAGETVSPDGVQVITIAGPESRVAKVLGLRQRVRRIVRRCRDLQADLIVLEGASWVLYHWLLLRRLRAGMPGTRIVYHAHNVEAVLRAETTGRLIRRITRWAEGNLFREADHATVVSAVDREQVAALYGVSPKIVPNGIDVERILGVTDDFVDAVRLKFGLEGELLLFMGMYAYGPNRDAIDFLVSSAMPAILERRPKARLVVLGGTVPHERPWLINPGVIDVDEVPAVVQASTAGLAPIFSGSGTRLKILEYAAGGLPVVATCKGAEGLGFVDGQEILLAEDPQGFAEQTVRILSDKELARSVAAAGRLRAHTDYAWRRLVDEFFGAIPSGSGTQG